MTSPNSNFSDDIAPTPTKQPPALSTGFEDIIDDSSLSPQDLIRELRLQQQQLRMREEALRKQPVEMASLQPYEALYYHAPVAHLVLSSDGHIEDANHCAAELLRASRSTLAGTPLGDYLHRSTHPTLQRHLQDLATGTGIQRCRLSLDPSTGTSVHLALWSVAIDGADDGHVHFLSTLIDRTAEYLLEQQNEELGQQLKEAHRMESLGRLASGIAHDFNNLLTLIIGYSKLAMNQLSDDMPMARHAREINKAGNHAAKLIDQLLAFTRSDGSTASTIDICQSIADIETMFHRLLGDDIELQVRLKPPLAMAHFDATQFQQVLMNLVVNAREAMTQGGHLVIRARHLRVDSTTGGHAPVDHGNYILVEVEDDGEGIPPEIRPHIFEPLFTTKSTARNHGFGLAITHGIVSQHDGFIDVESTPGEGTTFRIFLHCAEDRQPGDDHYQPTVLVVDDQPDLRDFATLVLESMDLEVISARDAEEALLLARACGDDLDLLVTDVTMPGLSGPELVRRIRKHHGDTKVLYMSGHDRTHLTSTLGIHVDDAFLEKPFSPENLSEMVLGLIAK